MELKFGTGGIRAVMGDAAHEFNRATVRRATHALVRVILGDDAPKSCAIAYDTRNNSCDYARYVAEILSECGIETFLFSETAPTPTLSYIIREKGLGWGVNITASHNPREYNGYKVYDSRGVQLMPDITEKISSVMGTSATEISADCGHLEQCLKLIPKAEPDFPFLYSALYGAGGRIVPKLFERMGFTRVTKIHCEPDGNFGGMLRPNPEETEVYDTLAAKECGAEIILATDPDCDRVGVMARHEGQYISMSGNQIAAVIFDEILKNTDAKDAPLITTQVSGRLCQEMAKARGIEVITLPTGFKYIGDMAEKTGKFLYGYEESCGYLFGNAARDKDGLLASGMIAAIASNLWKNGKTLYDKWLELCEQYGFFLEALESFPLGENVNVGAVENMKIPENAWIIIRPSGTEPKVKVYYGVKADRLTQAQDVLKKIHNDLRLVL